MTSEIPHIIHYCWFGGNPLPELAEKCLASW
ncbi:MAG: glycosyl transferase, partial [Treponema sp.]|nr:glycosyl transferase [Treponema sp.]